MKNMPRVDNPDFPKMFKAAAGIIAIGAITAVALEIMSMYEEKK